MPAMPASLAAAEFLPLAAKALASAETLLGHARNAVAGKVSKDGRISPALLEQEQFAAHGFAWMATYVEALRQLLAYATRMESEGRLGEIERLIVLAGFGEYLGQIAGGIPMSQGEICRPQDLG